jgi:hypothetical protein
LKLIICCVSFSLFKCLARAASQRIIDTKERVLTGLTRKNISASFGAKLKQ